MTKTKYLEMDNILNIVAEETGIPRDELDETTEFIDLGVDDILARPIVSKIAEETGLLLPDTIFTDCHTVSNLRSHLRDSLMPSAETTNYRKPSSALTRAANLSIVLQGKVATAKTTIFLLPDGSGSAMAYLRLPTIDPSVCLIGMNSPFLNASDEEKFSVEGIAAEWANEIKRRQPEGPYILGGWSAGGYYSFELSKYLVRKGDRVKKLVLIDSPCRLVYEELPMEVVHYLSKNNLMGTWGTKQPPTSVINHFGLSIRAISSYFPTPMKPPDVPEVFIIWAEDGVLKDADAVETGLDLDVKVTQMLLQRPDRDGPLGWDRLFPGTKLSVAKMPGNHFTIVHPPNVSCTYRFDNIHMFGFDNG